MENGKTLIVRCGTCRNVLCVIYPGARYVAKKRGRVITVTEPEEMEVRCEKCGNVTDVMRVVQYENERSKK